METKVRIGKITATPLLHVNELKPWRQRIVGSIVWFGLFLIWAILFSFQSGLSLANITLLCILLIASLISLLPTRNEYFLCEEGVGKIDNLGARSRFSRFNRWDSFQSFTVDNEKKQFTLKMSTGSVKLTSREHFDEVNRILSEHISVKQ